MIPRDCDVAIVGAGLAGLAAAVDLLAAGRDVQVIEAGDAVGGRVRTDHIDGLTLDRGFQVYNDGYPTGRALLDHAALDLRRLTGAVAVRLDGQVRFVADPRREPAWAAASLLPPIAPLPSMLRFAGYAARLGLIGAGRDSGEPALPFLLRRFGPELTNRVLRPFLAGVVLDDDLSCSRAQVEQVLRGFFRGRPALPAGGMASIPGQLADRVGRDRIHLGEQVTTIESQRVTTSAGTLRCRAVVLATGARNARQLVPALALPPLRDVTTWYHVADCGPGDLLGGRGVVLVDGERFSGPSADDARPLTNSVVLSDAVPEYASNNRVLVSSSAVGRHDSSAAESAVRRHLELLYGVSTRSWSLAATYVVNDALPAALPGAGLPLPHTVTDGLVVAGDWRQFPSIDGALASGRRAAAAVLAPLVVRSGQDPAQSR